MNVQQFLLVDEDGKIVMFNSDITPLIEKAKEFTLNGSGKKYYLFEGRSSIGHIKTAVVEEF